MRVLMVLPPDVAAPPSHRRHRFPHQGPALVAASVRADGVEMRAVDLELELFARETRVSPSIVDDDARFDRHLSGELDDEMVGLAAEMIERLGDVDVDAFALSLDRHTQIRITLLLAVELKRRFGHPVIVGGGNARAALAWLSALRARGVDFVTEASTPDEIRTAFRALAATDDGRWELAVEPMTGRQITPPDDWPTPDFSIYELDRYRRDPFAVEGPETLPAYDRSVGDRLFLPYHFTFDCQYACTFCERGGTQTAKSAERVVRDLAHLSETFACGDFMFFDSQINLLVEGLAHALIGAGLGIHWTDSYRVAPRRPANALELMARAGCIGLTFGVESASDRMLKRMVKGHTKAKATRVVQDAHALDMFVRVNLLPCFPGETPADHRETAEWLAENAPAIDDLAPSSFYLAEGAPVAQLADRFGIRIRGERALKGDHKFRKNLGSLAYDEIDGYSWEERERMLRPAEEELSRVWRDGRGGYAVAEPSQAFGLRRVTTTKAEAYERYRRWAGADRPNARAAEHASRPAPEASVSGRAADADVAPRGPPVPPGSARARIAQTMAHLLERHRFTLAPPADEPGRLTLRVRDPGGAEVEVAVERYRPQRAAFRSTARVSVWYRAHGPEPSWTTRVVTRIADLVCSPAFACLADELAPRLPVLAAARRQEDDEDVGVERHGVIDLVRAGLKPAASVVVESADAALREAADLPARAISRFAFVLDAHENLVRLASPAPGEGKRMLYVGRDQRTVERLRDLEDQLFFAPEAARTSDRERADLHAEFGRLMGFPACCARSFADAGHGATGQADVHFAIDRLGWHLRPVGWRCNHPAALQYELPFLIHVPCSAECRPTHDLVESVVAKLYPGESRRIIEEVLSQGAVVWPDDRVVFFRTLTRPDAEGVVTLWSFNVDAHPSVRRSARRADRRVARDVMGFPDARVEALKRHDGRIHVRVDGHWHLYEPPECARGAPPLVLVP